MSKARAANTYRWHKHGQIKNTVALLREKRRADRDAGQPVGPRPTFDSVKAQAGMGGPRRMPPSKRHHLRRMARG